MVAIEARGLTKTYRGFWGGAGHPALHGLDLTIPEGTAFGLIGPNGAGKTTFIKLMLGVCRPSGGEVRLFGGSPNDPSVRARVGYMPERLHLPSALTPPEFLRSVARLKGLPLDAARVDHELGRVGLTVASRRRIGGFSKGMRQRLGLAAALLGQPDLLILDEPTDGVDPLGRAEVRRLLAEERARGATLFINSHLLSETERICDRVGILAAGRLVREGPLLELRQAGARWRVRFAQGADAAALAALGFAAEGDSFGVEAEDAAALNALLDRARASGALVVELTRAERDLESVLAEALGPSAVGEAA